MLRNHLLAGKRIGNKVSVKVCILAGFGINADKELALAFNKAGADSEFVHIEDLRTGIRTLETYAILAFPGGFSFGDHLGSGKVLSHIVKKSIKNQIDALLARGGLILGICNGFQTLVKMGLLPNMQGNWEQEVSLLHNEGGHFIDQWVHLDRNGSNASPWLKGIDSMYVPVRHGEGRLIVRDERIAQGILQNNLVAFEYTNGAPNGSYLDIAGLTDRSGQILGMMPHPECFLVEEQRPDGAKVLSDPKGMALFYNAVAYMQSISD